MLGAVAVDTAPQYGWNGQPAFQQHWPEVRPIGARGRQGGGRTGRVEWAHAGSGVGTGGASTARSYPLHWAGWLNRGLLESRGSLILLDSSFTS